VCFTRQTAIVWLRTKLQLLLEFAKGSEEEIFIAFIKEGFSDECYL
jgi:hypothetical protein